MTRSLASILLLGLLVGTTAASANIELRIGSVTIDPAAMGSASCVQVPIWIRDPDMNRDLRDLTFTVELSGDTGVIAGGITANMLVANAFGAGANFTGITNPATDLTNVNGQPTPSCALIFNQATQGSGPAADFAAGNANATWLINNNGGAVGRKTAFSIDPTFNNSIATTIQNQDHLVAILEIPILANPGVAQLQITATSNMVVANANIYTWDDGTRSGEERVQMTEDLDLSSGPGIVNIFDPVDCSAMTVADDIGSASGSSIEIGYLDPMAGGNGGEVTATASYAGSPDQVRFTTTDGLDSTVAASPGSTSLSATTAADGTPATGAASTTWTGTAEVEFPPASGTYVSGAACNATTSWAAPTCMVAFDSIPVAGGATNVDVTLTDVSWDGTKFGTLSLPGGGTVDLTAPTSTAGTTLTFDDALTIATVGPGDVGTYMVSTSGPGGPTSCSVPLSLDPPVNTTSCASIGQVSMGDMSTVTLSGTSVVDWDITYNGVTTNVPGATASFDFGPVVGSATSVTVTANGFDMGGSPVSDPIACTLDYVAPVCGAATQSPDTTISPVDIGTVITLELGSSGAVSSTIDGVPMTDVSGTPGADDAVTWQATHTAVADTTIDATLTNPDGEIAICSWSIDVVEPVANQVDCGTLGTATIGSDVTVPLAGTSVDTWDITYNGVTTNLPGATASFDFGPIVGGDIDVLVAANGLDEFGDPATDSVVCSLDFPAPTCAATQDPDSTVTPVDVGTVITLTLETTGASSATVDAVPMNDVAGAPGTDDAVTWEATHVAVEDTTLDALATNPEGETAMCSWAIDINCEDPTLVEPVPGPGETGLTVQGTPGCFYDARVAGPFSCDVVTIEVDAGGTGTDDTFQMPPFQQVVVEVGQVGSLPDTACPAVTALAVEIPTADGVGLGLLALLLAAGGIVLMRRRV